MAEFPKRIDCGDFEMVKPQVSFKLATELFNVVDRNRVYLQPWLGWVDYVKSPEDEFGVVQSIAQSDKGAYLILVNGNVCGALSFVQEYKSRMTVEIGYWLDNAMNGRGIMTRAVDKLIGLAFDVLGANRVEIQAAVENKKSRAIPERLGFKQEGILRQREIVRPGVIQDIAIYSKLKSEWEKGKAK